MHRILSVFSLISRYVVARIPLHLLYCLNKPTIARDCPSCLPSLAQEGPRRQALLLNCERREKNWVWVWLGFSWNQVGTLLLQGPGRVAVRHRARLGGATSALTNKPTQETSPSWLRSRTQQGADHAYAPEPMALKGFALIHRRGERGGEMRVCVCERKGVERV